MTPATLQLDIPVLLPEIPHERDCCIERLREQLASANGIHSAQVEKQPGGATLRLEYDADLLSLRQVRRMAERTGASLTRRYRHENLRIGNMDCDDCARSIEHILSRRPGVLAVSVNAAAERMRIEYDTHQINRRELVRLVESIGFDIKEEHEEEHHHGPSPLLLAGLAGLFLAAGLLAEHVFQIHPYLVIAIYLLAYLFGGLEPTRHGLISAFHLSFNIDFLMVLAAVGAAVLGHWAEGAFLLFLFSLGHALEHMAMDKARHALSGLGEMAPRTGRVRREGREQELVVEELLRGDVIVVRPGERIPADGQVILGASSVDQSAITGESIPAAKTAGDPVFAGTLNGAGALEIEVTRLAQDSTMARVIQMVAEAQTQKSPTQRFADRFEKIFVPAALISVLALIVLPPLFGWLPWRESLLRGLTLLVAASPCALAIATPSAVLAGIAQAARNGVLIKGGAHLENLGRLNALAFDKTGTLTAGKPEVTDVFTLDSISEERLLQTAAAVESRSGHPLARAVLVRAAGLPALDMPVEDVQNLNGKGITARLDGQILTLASPSHFAADPALPPALSRAAARFEQEGKTVMLLRSDDRYLGALALADQPRANASSVVARLKALGLKTLVMLTGDNQCAGQAVSDQVGLTGCQAGLLPEQKVAAVQRLLAENGSVAMVGDGINDAPALATATVGIAMGGAGSAAALETADVALMGDDLSRLPFAVGLSRQANRIVRQNLIISLGVVAMLVPVAVFGWAAIGPAIFFHEGSTILVVLNALRLLAYKES